MHRLGQSSDLLDGRSHIRGYLFQLLINLLHQLLRLLRQLLRLLRQLLDLCSRLGQTP
jgi:hypothetical protein